MLKIGCLLHKSGFVDSQFLWTVVTTFFDKIMLSDLLKASSITEHDGEINIMQAGHDMWLFGGWNPA